MKRLLLTSAALALITGHAFAWDGTNNGNNDQLVEQGPGAQSNAKANASAYSGSTSRASQRLSVSIAPTITVGSSVASATTPAASDPPSDPPADPSSATHHATHAYGGGYSGHSAGVAAVVQQFPPSTAYSAPLAGGPCNSSGISAGAQTPFFGLTASHQRFDYGCAGERMGDLTTFGQQIDWAYQCQDDEKFRKASASIGRPCPGDEKRQAPTQAAVQPVTYVLPAKPEADTVLHGTADQYGYCYGTMTVAEKRRHPECG